MNGNNKIYGLKTTKEIWDSLSINYKRTKDVQLRKAATLMRHYVLEIMAHKTTNQEGVNWF